MCGIAGFMMRENRSCEDPESLVLDMAAALAHRGPDDFGAWVDRSQRVALSNRRLAILDLSPAGHQPMTAPGGRYVIAYNGEVYNYRVLKAKLEKEGFTFAGDSDTEVLIAAVEAWGFVQMLEAADGMFAVAVYDQEEDVLYLARDRFGEKPLYYGVCGGSLLFGSELKALRRHPDMDVSLDHEAVSIYLDLLCVPAPYSIYSSIRKVPAGSWISIDKTLTVSEPKRYWDPRTVPIGSPVRSIEEGVEELEGILVDALKERLVSDRPLGSFLSGGIDSSLIVSLLRRKLEIPQKTFSVGFEDAAFNEADRARQVAELLGTQHFEITCTEQDAVGMRDRLFEYYDEPFADSSQLAVLQVSRLAATEVTVSLSGDGGDELFGGYYRYQWGAYANGLRYIPGPLKALAASIAAMAARGSGVSSMVMKLLPGAMRSPRPAEKLQKLADILRTRTGSDQYRKLVAVGMGLARNEEPSVGFLRSCWHGEDMMDGMQLADVLWYLPDDLLVKVDRASMAFSLEGRAPFLDPEVFAFARRVPAHLRMHRGEGKILLRRLLKKLLPDDLVKPDKQGFEVPIHHWLKGPWRAWAEDHFSAIPAELEPLLDKTVLDRSWQALLNGRGTERHRVWSVLVLLDWYRNTHG